MTTQHPGPELLRVHRVSVTYGHEAPVVQALTEVSLEVRRGEVLLITGPSGSGKSTLLKIMGALRPPTAGDVYVGGTSLRGFSPEALSHLRLHFFGFIFQHYNLFPTLTAAENVALMLDLKGIRGDEANVRSRALLDLVGLSHRAHVRPQQLSGGERQRTAIARALAANPAVILADEPTAAIDAVAGRHVASLFASLVASGDRAVVIATHDLRLMEFASRAVRLDDGRLLMEDRSAAARILEMSS